MLAVVSSKSLENRELGLLRDETALSFAENSGAVLGTSAIMCLALRMASA